jgi:hypothetical protein
MAKVLGKCSAVLDVLAKMSPEMLQAVTRENPEAGGSGDDLRRNQCQEVLIPCPQSFSPHQSVSGSRITSVC